MSKSKKRNSTKKDKKVKDTKPRMKNWFGTENEYAITETIRKTGRLGGRKLG